MRILFTGASSFTGLAFVKALAGAGHEVVCPLTGGLDRYTGVRQQRVEQLKPLARLPPNAPFGSEAFLTLVHEGNWDLLCHHAAEVTNYRSPQFDAFEALRKNTLNLSSVLAALQNRGLRAVVLTGSVFENDEGVGNEPLRAFSPYGLSKGLTFQVFRYWCGQARLPLAKFVIPNPFGPFEEERFTSYLMRAWQAGQAATVKTPLYVRDHIPVDLLALVYAQWAERAILAREPLLRLRPSGYVESVGAFAGRVAAETRRRLNWPCACELGRQQEFAEPLVRVNADPAIPAAPNWSEGAFWDSFVQYYEQIA